MSLNESPLITKKGFTLILYQLVMCCAGKNHSRLAHPYKDITHPYIELAHPYMELAHPYMEIRFNFHIILPQIFYRCGQE